MSFVNRRKFLTTTVQAAPALIVPASVAAAGNIIPPGVVSVPPTRQMQPWHDWTWLPDVEPEAAEHARRAWEYFVWSMDRLTVGHGGWELRSAVHLHSTPTGGARGKAAQPFIHAVCVDFSNPDAGPFESCATFRMIPLYPEPAAEG